MLQVNLLHIPVWGPSHTDNIESVAVQMEGMAQVWLLNCKRVSQHGTQLLANVNCYIHIIVIIVLRKNLVKNFC
jgi:hypothetical protein